MGVEDIIIDGFLYVLSIVLDVLLSPLEAIDAAINVVGSIPFLIQFFEVIAYILPWNNLLPLFVIVISVIGFKVVISLLKTLWDILPFV